MKNVNYIDYLYKKVSNTPFPKSKIKNSVLPQNRFNPIQDGPFGSLFTYILQL